MVYSTRRFVLCLTLCHFVLVFFSPFSIAITSLGEERANLSAFRTFVRFVLVWIRRFPLPLGVWKGLRFVIVALPGLSLIFFWIAKDQNFYKLAAKYPVRLGGGLFDERTCLTIHFFSRSSSVDPLALLTSSFPFSCYLMCSEIQIFGFLVWYADDTFFSQALFVVEKA